MPLPSQAIAISQRLQRPWTLLNGWLGHARRSLSDPATATGKAQTDDHPEKRSPTENLVEFAYVGHSGRVLQDSGQLVDRSESGMRFVTRAKLRNGVEFVIWDPQRLEHAATVVWTKRRVDGYLVGVQATPVGRTV